MNAWHFVRQSLLALSLSVIAANVFAQAQSAKEQFEAYSVLSIFHPLVKLEGANHD